MDLIVGYLESAMLQLAPVSDSFRLETDASDIALGAMLYDKEVYDSMPEGEMCLPLKFMSKTLAHKQQGWSRQEREALAVIWALDQCKSLVKGMELYVHCN